MVGVGLFKQHYNDRFDGFLLASLHSMLVILAIAAAGLSLALESRVTSKLYEFLLQGTPEEEERVYIGVSACFSGERPKKSCICSCRLLLGRHSNLSEFFFARGR
jgi:hypothetical protein